MAKAMKSTMKETRHRWCRWHVLKNAKDRLGKVYSKHKGFKHEFNKLVTDEIDITKFERIWDTLVKKIQAVKEQVLKAAIQVPRKMGKAILHGYLLCRNDKHTEE